MLSAKLGNRGAAARHFIAATGIESTLGSSLLSQHTALDHAALLLGDPDAAERTRGRQVVDDVAGTAAANGWQGLARQADALSRARPRPPP